MSASTQFEATVSVSTPRGLLRRGDLDSREHRRPKFSQAQQTRAFLTEQISVQTPEGFLFPLKEIRV